MAKTIKDAMAQIILEKQLLNDNALLVIKKRTPHEHSVVSVCYVEGNSIKEDNIASLFPTTTIRYNERVLGVFIPNEVGEKSNLLITVYDLERHEFVENDFLNAVYYAKATEEKPMQYIKSMNY